MGSKIIVMALQVDTSALVAQTRVIAGIIKRFAPSLEELPDEITKNLVNKFLVALKGVVISYNVTTIGTDGSRKTVRVLRYRSGIEDFTTAFWASEINVIH